MTKEEFILIIQFEILCDNIDIPYNTKWIAMDQNGEIWWYRYKPKILKKHSDWRLSNTQVYRAAETSDFESNDHGVLIRYKENRNTDGWENSLFNIKEL